MSAGVAITVAVILLLLNFYFVGAEFALISSRRTKIEPLARAGSRRARITLRALEDVSMMMAGAQFGITVCTVALGAIAEPAIAHQLEPLFAQLGIPEVAIHPIALAIATFVVVGFHVVLGEMVPKNIALAAPERAALILGPPLVGLVTVLRPLIWLLNKLANGCLRLLRVQPRDEVSSTYTHEEVTGLVDESRREGMLDDDAYRLVSGALMFGSRTVADVLVPNAELRFAGPDCTLADIEALCADTGFSRFPIARKTADPASIDVLGYIHIKDVLEPDPERRHRPIAAKWIRPMVTLTQTTGLRDALRVMRTRETHMARVADEQGTLIGVVALADVLAELVGEVRVAVTAEMPELAAAERQPA